MSFWIYIRLLLHITRVVGSLAGMIGKALASMYGIKNMSLVDSLFGTSFGGGMMSGESSGGVYGSSGYSSSGVTSTGGQATVHPTDTSVPFWAL